VLTQRANLVKSLQVIIHNRYGPRFTIEPFGSTLYGVSRPTSDLDLTVVRAHRRLPRRSIDVKANRGTWIARMGLARKLTAPDYLRACTHSESSMCVDGAPCSIYDPNHLARTLVANGFRSVSPIHASVPIG
jgi:hypothetical protein